MDYIEGVLPKKIPDGFKLSCDTPYIGENMFTICYCEDDYYIGVIDIEGNIIILPTLYSVGVFKNGMAY